MSCIIPSFRNPKDAAFEAIKDEVGTNETLFTTYVTDVVGGVDENGHYTPSEEFSNWYKSRGYKTPLDFNANGGKMKEAIKRYYRFKHPDASKTILDQASNTAASAYGYSDTIARNEAKGHAVAMLNDIFRDVEFVHNVKVNGNKKEFYQNQLVKTISKHIAYRIAKQTGKKDPELKAETDKILKEIPVISIKEIEDKFNKPTVQDRNLLALYAEVINNDELIDELLRRSDINIGKIDEEDDNYKLDESERVDTIEEDTVDGNPNQEYDLDSSIALFDHSGTYTSVMSHLGGNIKAYFNSLKKIKDANYDKTPVYDTDNALGLPARMNASQCATMLYHNGDYTNVNSMIQSIHRIAKEYPGFAAFETFARKLENDRDFANLVYATFGKIVISKLEVIKENGIPECRISNTRSNKREALTYEFINTVRSSAGLNDNDYYTKKLNDINKDLEDNVSALSRPNSEAAQTIINDLTSVIKAYYPTVQASAIKSYLYSTKNAEGNVDVANNVESLISKIEDTIEESKKTLVNILKQRADLAEANKYNNRKDVKKAARKDPSVLKDTTSIIARETTTEKLRGVAAGLAELLVPYSDVQIELNSVNALGNQSSDVINNNTISYINQILNSSHNVKDSQGHFTPESTISRLAADFFGIEGDRTQYKWSTALVEHKDENGNVINYGMFKEVSPGKYEPTEYAGELLKGGLFNGAHNYDNNEHILYSRMDEIDYTATAFYAFFNDKRTIKDYGGITLGNYFMRTPSDAPKNFLISAPRYTAEGLIKSDGSVNHSHPIWQQFALAFKQELVNAATAFGVIYETMENGEVKIDTNGKPIRTSLEDRELYKEYHYNGKQVTDKDGKLTGKVFTSDKLVANVTNYGKKFIDDNIDFFYGGEQNDGKTHLAVKKRNGEVVDIELNPTQRANMVAMLDEFIKASINEAKNKFKKVNRVLTETPSDTEIAEFALNYKLFYINSNDLYEGDTKFYKGTQDFLKRAKEAQAAGVPYGTMDYENVFDHGIYEDGELSSDIRGEIKDSVIGSKEFTSKFGKVKQFSKFRGVTIKNSIITGEAVAPNGRLAKKLTKIFKDNGMTQKAAEEKAAKMMEGYANTTVNDAQSYITVEEWIRRIAARGQFAKYSKLITKVMNGDQLNADDINEFIQVQKNFYYDQHYDERTKVRVPRQIKNAEFVLVPQLIEGTELEQVYELMNDLGIDQLNTEETSKAGKARVLELWDNEGKLNDKAVEDFKAKAKDYIEYYDYNHLYTQQETPQHMNSENKAAIQIMKKIVDNITEDSPLWETKQKFMATYAKMVKMSYTETLNELGVKVNKDGTVDVSNVQKMYDAFMREAERLGVDSNLVDYLTIDPLTGLPKMPNGFNITSQKVENIAQAFFNSNITRQKLPGFHAAQVTDIGFRTFAENKEQIGYDDSLHYHPEGWIHEDGNEITNAEYNKLSDYEKAKYTKGVTHFIEVRLPKSAFGLQGKTDEEALEILRSSHTDSIIGYRIPTEGKQSIAIMKVVGFISDGYGSTIVVPNDWVGQTGSDFDIDSVYGIQYATESDEYGMYKVGKEGDRRSMQNTILDCMLEILRSDLSLEENLGRSNFDDIVDQLDYLKKEGVIDSDNRTSYDFFDQAEFQNEVMSNARLKGLSVVRDTFCSICNTVRPTLNGLVIPIAYPADKYSLKELKARFGDVESKDGKYIVHHRMFGWSNDNKNVDGRILTSYSSQTTAHILDAVKAGMVPNVNDTTFAIYKTLIDIGSNYETAIRFMALPGVGLVARAINDNNSIYAVSAGNPVRTAIRQWTKQIFGDNFTKKNGREMSFKKLMETLNANGVDLQYDYDTDSFTGTLAEFGTIDTEQITKRLLNKKLASRPPVRRFVHNNFYSGLISPSDDVIFVFGSNPVGINGILNRYGEGRDSGGAAAFAQRNFGVKAKEIMNNRISDSGRAYGLVTVTRPGAKKSLNKAEIIENIKKLYNTANSMPNKTFAVAYTNTTTESLNGYTGKEMAEMFKEAGPIPTNIKFSDEWKNAGYFSELIKKDALSDESAFDLQTIIQYHTLAKFSQAVNDMTRCCNPDKFGAKQSVYETYKVFSDITRVATENKADVLTVNVNNEQVSLLEAIYPGVAGSTIEQVMSEDRTNDSKYKTLYSFLRFSTAPSIAINGQIFDTQHPEFRQRILKLQESLTYQDIPMSAKLYKDFEKYVLSYLYQQAPFIKGHLTIDKATGQWRVAKNVTSEQEFNRIKGATGVQVEVFEVEDITNPTQDEINIFASFTPAEKLRWVQQHYSNSLIGKYVSANLHGRNGQQVITFTEDNDDIENVYQAFNDAYYNSDPLIKLMASDLIKYAFVVEGFRMSKNAICKTIQNQALMDGSTKTGTGIVEWFQTELRDLQSLSDEVMDQLVIDYVRSAKPKEVKVFKADDERINTEPSGLVIFNDGNLKNTPNIICIKRGKRNVYYAKAAHSVYPYYYPVNNLERNEIGPWSSIAKNNIYASPAYWNDVIDGVIEANADDSSYRWIDPHISSTGGEDFDLNHPIANQHVNETSAFNIIKDTVSNWFSDENNPRKMFIWSPRLSHYLKKVGQQSIQEIDGKDYIITKVNLHKAVDNYLQPGNKNDNISHFTTYHQAIINQLREKNIVNTSDVFLVVPKQETVYSESTLDESIEDMGEKSVRQIQIDAGITGNEIVEETNQQLKAAGIDADAAIIANNMEKTFGTLAEYASKESKRIINGCKRFIEDKEHDTVYSIDSPEAIDVIRNNANERQRFLKLILDARAFRSKFEMYNDLSVDSQDDEIKRYLDIIKKSVDDLNDPIISKAEIEFGRQYLDKLSDDPRIKQEILSVLDGFTSTGTIEAWINDLQETTNPLINLITKEVMSNIRAREMEASDAARLFKTELHRRFKEAAEKGEPINWSHVINDAGIFIQSYNDKFRADYDNLVANRDVAKELLKGIEDKESDEYDRRYENYLRAQQEVNKWMLAHVEQPFVDSYYKEKNDLVDWMLQYNKEIFIEYNKLIDERDEYRSHIANTALDQAWIDKIKDVNRRIRQLENEFAFDGVTETWSPKPERNPSAPSRTAVQARNLKRYKEELGKIYDKYFDTKENVGFRTTLDNNLRIISDYEIKGSRSTYTLEDYKKAKEWVESNARFVVDDEVTKKVNRAFATLSEGTSRKGSPAFKAVVANHKAYDRFGVVDATDFTEKEIEQIKDEEEMNSRIGTNGANNDRILIHNGKNDDKIYKKEFYSRMTPNGMDNAEYFKTVTKINTILRKVYDDGTASVNTSKLTQDELDELATLYTKLGNIKKHIGSTNGKEVADFIKDNVEFTNDDLRFEAEKALAKSKGTEYYKKWYQANTEVQKNNMGNPVVDDEGNEIRVPNNFLYGKMSPKTPSAWIDTRKMDALQTLQECTDKHPTKYWDRKLNQMTAWVNEEGISGDEAARRREEFNKWFENNTIFDPRTQTIRPIKCWMQTEIIGASNGKWEANFTEKHTVPKEEYKNAKYEQAGTIGQNYKVGTGYDNETSRNNSEVEFGNWLQATLLGLARTKDAQKFFKDGYAPARASDPEHDAWWYAKEAGKWVGFIAGANGREKFDKNIGYEHDWATPMPMTHLLREKDLEEYKERKPRREDFNTDEEYTNALDEYNKKKAESDKAIADSHKKLLDKDWEEVIAEFIQKAGHYNAVQENKALLFYGLNMLKKIKHIQPTLGFSDLHKDDKASTKNTTRYNKGLDTTLISQYENWIRRLICDQYRRPNKTWTKIASVMQSITSSNFMMLNLRGGIANVTLGETQIFAEAWAKEYFGVKHMNKATIDWTAAIPSFFAGMYKETSTTLVDAIIKYMNVVDFDDLVESGRTIMNFGKYSERLRDMMYSPQTMGEHFMQNRAMLAMMHSHRLVKNNDKDINGKTEYILQNESEYIRDCHERALKAVLSPQRAQQFDAYVKKIMSDDNTAKEVAWVRRDVTSEFATRLTEEEREKFIEKKKKFEEVAKKEFETLPTLFSQMALSKEGYMSFADGSIMQRLMTKNEDGTIDAYKILGTFKGRVISVNKKIHGVYDKLGSAQLEKYWFGPLVMQYHKHIFPGLMKRWRRQGGFNEERGTFEKGSYIALKDFLAIPIRRVKDKAGMTDAEAEAMEGAQNILQSITDFCLNIGTYWNILPKHEKANIRRNLGDAVGVLLALFVAVGIRCMTDDDDDNILTNLCLYEADRLASESFQFNPIGAASEAKKLWSSPVAVSSIIGDVMNSCGTLAQILIEGDDYDPYYHSGKYANQHRLKVYIERRIPIYRGIKSVLEIANDNHYYKLGDNMLTIVPVKDIAKWIKK